MNKHAVVRKASIAEVVAALPVKGKSMFPPFHVFEGQKPPFHILEDTMVSNSPEIHTTEGDLWLCLEGEVQFTCGGEMLDQKEVGPNEMVGSRIENGETMTLTEGDWLWIPPHVPHQHAAQGTARLLIIKIPAD